ncbi:MAG TPA: XRE family transcriptional regulator [Armatimonadota bacterium]|jgi:quercetin dioxygenase-like cupin family protein
MSEQLREIAARIREIREIAEVTPESLAAELEISPETYREYESGTADIPVSVVYEIAAKFNVELTALLTGENPRLHTYALARAGQGVPVERRQDYRYRALAPNFIHKQAEPFLVTVPPSAPEDPVHFNTHPGQEFNYVLSGVVKIVIDGHEIVLQPGDSLYFDSSCPHGMKALNDAPAEFLAIIM